MSNKGPIYMPGDAVYYSGTNERRKQALTSKEGKPLRGWIHAPVTNVEGEFVVWFPETKDSDSYIFRAEEMSKARPPKEKGEGKKHEGPVVEHMPIRRKKSEDE